MKRSPGSGGRTMSDLSSLRLVEVPQSAPPYDCQVHGARCPADADAAVVPAVLPTLPDLPAFADSPALPALPDGAGVAAAVGGGDRGGAGGGSAGPAAGPAGHRPGPGARPEPRPAAGRRAA